LFATWHPKRRRWSSKTLCIGRALIGFLHLARGAPVHHVESIAACLGAQEA